MSASSDPPKSSDPDLDLLCVNAIRFLSVDAVQRANSGHPGAPLGAAPTAYALWDRVLKHNPRDPEWPNRDRFALSVGHASAMYYSLLHLYGYDVSLDDVKSFRQWRSITPGHPERGLTPGVDTTTGPLGQGFANAVGMAIAETMLAERFNRPGHQVVDHFTYCLASDGDMMEGIVSEAASLAGTLGLGKLICLYDDNEISIEGSTDLAFREDVPAHFRACGWHVAGPVDGLDVDAIERAIRDGQAETERPTLIPVTTTIAYGSPNLAGKAASHGAPLGEEEVALTRQALGWPYPPFEIPVRVLEHTRSAVGRGEETQAEWKQRLEAYRKEYSDEAAALELALSGNLPLGWEAALDDLVGTFDSPAATRVVSGAAINALAGRVPELVGGAGDLGPSNNVVMAGLGDYQYEDRSGRNLHFGVREHAMCAVATGMALHGGLLPFCATFLCFSDYMRGAIRVAALSEQHVVYVLTHDSLGVGEDGPTHQPISQTMALRLIPRLTVIRPADADETLEAWRLAASRRGGPTALVLSRQDVPPLASIGAEAGARGNVARGAYVVRGGDGMPDVLLIGTGSEVQLAIGAAKSLEQDGVRTRVVSMPSWELFEEQPSEYRESVLPHSVRARVAVEAGTTIGWHRYVGLDGAVVGRDDFGKCGPGALVMEKLGFTTENVAAAARAVLGSQR